MKIHNLGKEDVLKTLLTSINGLTEEEAKRRIIEYGYNEIKETKKIPLYFRFLSQLTHFFAILLWLSATLCFISEYFHPNEGMLTLGIAIVFVILINAAFSFLQEYKAEKTLELLKKLLPYNVKVIRDGIEKNISVKEIVPGDILLLSEGDKIPADARLIDSNELKVNNAPLTGESEPVSRNHAPYMGDFLESPNIVFAGTTVLSGNGTGVVFATGMSTEFGRIAHLTSGILSGLTPLQKEIIRTTRIIATISVIVGITFFTLGFFIGRSFWSNFIFAIGIIVALIPEGLLPTVTVSLAMSSLRMAKKKALIKSLNSVETLGAVTTICTDKTGTLTQNKMSVTEIWFNNEIKNISDIQKDSINELLIIAQLCNNSRFIKNEFVGDPTEIALLKISKEIIGDINSERLREIPFDSERKRMSTINLLNDQYLLLSKGAPETLIPLCNKILINSKELSFEDKFIKEVESAFHKLTEKGLRVLALAYRRLENNNLINEKSELLENELVFTGLIGIEDPPRPEVPEALIKCHDAGIKVIMITGDGSKTATAIAKQIGLIKKEPLVIEGKNFELMTDIELREILKKEDIIFARMAPKHKLRIVSILKDEGEIVAVTGDGVNDAPALKKADIGIAMGITGTDVAKEAADIILLDDNFATIVNAIEEGRTVFENIRKFITYIFSSNIPEAIPYLSYILLKIPLPLTVIQILSVDLGTDILPALALGTEKPTPTIMKQPPRKLKKRLLDLSLILRAYLFLGPIEAIACMFGYFYVLYNGGWKWGELLSPNNILYLKATTACLTGIVITQIGNVFVCRSQNESIFKIGLFSNKFIFLGIFAELSLLLFITYHPIGNNIFGTNAIDLNTWLVLLPFGLILIIFDETRKLLSKAIENYLR